MEDGERRGRTRGRGTKLNDDEHIPAIATTILTPIDAKKYIHALINVNETSPNEINPTLVAKLIEQALGAKEASGNRRLIDTITSACYILRDMDKTEWSRGRKTINGKADISTANKKLNDVEAQTDAIEIAIQPDEPNRPRAEIGTQTNFAACEEDEIAEHFPEILENANDNGGENTFADEIK